MQPAAVLVDQPEQADGKLVVDILHLKCANSAAHLAPVSTINVYTSII